MSKQIENFAKDSIGMDSNRNNGIVIYWNHLYLNRLYWNRL